MTERRPGPTRLEREVAAINLAKKAGIDPVPDTAVELLGKLPTSITRGIHVSSLGRTGPLSAEQAEHIAGTIIFTLDQIETVEQDLKDK